MACNPAEQIEHVEFDRRMTQQMDDVTESLCVLQTKSVPAVADGPVLALFAEDSGLHGTEARLCIGGASRAIPRSTRLRSHLNFYWPFVRGCLDRIATDRSIRDKLSPPGSRIFAPYCSVVDPPKSVKQVFTLSIRVT